MASTRLLLEGADIEALLARVRDEHGAGARIVHADKVRTGGIAGFFTRERYAVTVEVSERAVDAPGTLLELADAIDAAEEAEARVVLGTMTPDPAPRPAAADAAALSTERPDFAAVLAELAHTTRGPVPEATEPQTTVPQTTVPESRRRLIELGVPRPIADQVVDGEGLRESLVRALAVLEQPTAPTLAAGDVLVVVGDGAAAYEIACVAARRLRLDPTKVLLVAPSTLGTGIAPARRLSGPAEARRRSARLHRADVPTVVAVDAPCNAASGEWARDVADALGARAVWAAVDATRKTVDSLDQLSVLGRLDGLAVRATEATRDPGSVLGLALDLGLPTVLLEHRPGTAAAWASLLMERMGGRA